MVVIQTNTHDNVMDVIQSDNNKTKKEINTHPNNSTFYDSSHCISTNNVSSQNYSTNDVDNQILIDNQNESSSLNNNNEELLIDRLYKRRQLLLQHLSVEIQKYEQLCWDEMAITGTVPHESNFLSDHFNIRCNSETRNPIISTPNKVLDPPNSSSAANRSRGIAARLKFRNSRRSKSAHDRIPESPQRSFHVRNKTDLSPTRNSLTDNLIDDNSESKKSWKWWRLNKDTELFNNVRRRQSIGLIAEQYLRYFTNDKNGHSRGGSLPPTDNNNNNNISKNEEKIPSENQKINVRKSLQQEDILNILNNHHQSNGECSHVKTDPATPDGHLTFYHKSFRQDQMKQQQQQQRPQYQLNGNFAHHESCILMPRYVPANDLQRINCSHQRIRHFSGHQINEPVFFNNRNNQLLSGYINQNNFDSSYNHLQTWNNTKKQSSQANKILTNHHVFYRSPSSSSSSYTSQAKNPNVFEHAPNAYFYSLQRRNHSSSNTKEHPFEAPCSVSIVSGGTMAPFIVTSSPRVSTTTATASTTIISTLPSTAPPIPPRAYVRRPIVSKNGTKLIEETVSSDIIDKKLLDMNKLHMIEKQQFRETNKNITNITTPTITTYSNNMCKPVVKIAETAMNLLQCSSRCFDGNDQHPYFNCINNQQHYVKPNILSNNQIKDKVPSNHSDNSFHKTSELKSMMHYHQQQLQPPLKSINHQFASNTHEVKLFMCNEGSTIENRKDRFKSHQNNCSISNNHLNKNLMNNQSHNRISVKNDLLNIMNIKLQTSHPVTNPHTQLMYKNNLSNNINKNNEVCLMFINLYSHSFYFNKEETRQNVLVTNKTIHYYLYCLVFILLKKVRYQLTEDSGVRWRNFVDWLKLDIDTVGCWLSGLVVKCLRAKPVGLGFESRVVRDRGCALLRSPILGRNGRPVLPGFPW
ncbi:Ataxin-3, variant 3 [Schistosoma haematobium]|uniref:Ataxin-3, variant 3 n=1 Tax=Schistosoma haematobium TaxID=6185 RepID=A0A922IQV1_SCHHA|nr:Ataxin-3, variant 3 [Schistosoma haematobium]KAH9585101.1 Ataxin-3, variant 3 [Schistosoma haematobium]